MRSVTASIGRLFQAGERFCSGQGKETDRAGNLPPHLAHRLLRLGRARGRRAVLLLLRSRRSLPGAARAHVPGPLPGAGHRPTVAVIAASYTQIIEVFPGGGGGYIVAPGSSRPRRGGRRQRPGGRLRAHHRRLGGERRGRPALLLLACGHAATRSCSVWWPSWGFWPSTCVGSKSPCGCCCRSSCSSWSPTPS